MKDLSTLGKSQVTNASNETREITAISTPTSNSGLSGYGNLSQSGTYGTSSGSKQTNYNNTGQISGN